MKDITIYFQDASAMRYPTAGDYLEKENEEWAVFVARTEDWRHQFLVLMHELVEMALTKHRGIRWSEIDSFDMEGGGKDSDDPGALATAPYHKEHMFAENVERFIADELGVDWNDYNTALDALTYKTGE